MKIDEVNEGEPLHARHGVGLSPPLGSNSEDREESMSDFEFNEIDDMAVSANPEERFNQEQVLDFRQIDTIEEDELNEQYNINSGDGDFVEDFGEDAINPD